MTDKATLLALADKLEKAGQGSSALDQEIFLAINDGQGWERNKWGTGICREYKDEDTFVVEHATVPMWTSGIDAALTLIPDGMSPSVGQNVHHKHWNAFVLAIKDDEPVTVASATAPFAAIAMCAAALRARAA